MMYRIRESVLGGPAYRPGRTPEQFALDSGQADAIKMTSNELPFGPLDGVEEHIVTELAALNRYPDATNRLVTKAICSEYGLEPDSVLVSSGSATLLLGLLQMTTTNISEVVLAWRTFEAMIPQMASVGAKGIMVPLVNHKHDLDGMAAAITERTSLVYVCNPNNPTGTVCEAAELIAFFDQVPKDLIVVLDEAYIHFADKDSTLDGLIESGRWPNVVVLRTFSKAYGLAGLRCGFAVGNPAVMQNLRKVLLPFGVTDMASSAAIASLQPDRREQFDSRLALVRAERDRVVTVLKEMGIAVVEPSQSNFVFLPYRNSVADIVQGYEAKGLLVRPYADTGVRVTIAFPEENEAFLRASEELFAAGIFDEKVEANAC